MACKKNAPGTPCHGCTSCFTLGELPDLSIAGMHISSDWRLSEDCCATIEFEFDTPQADIKLDGGDVYTADQTITSVRDAVYYPQTCGTYVQAVIVDSPSGPVFIQPIEPPYVGCCPSRVVMNTVTCTSRERAGQRFLVCVRAVGRSVTIQKTNITCNGTSAVRYLVTSKTYYSGNYTYYNWKFDEWTYSYTDSNASCWSIGTNTSSGALFDFGSWDGSASGTEGPFGPYAGGGYLIPTAAAVCRQKVLDAMPTAQTLTFNDNDCLGVVALATTFVTSDCTLDGLPCVDCYCSQPCWDSGPTGASQPRAGFCGPTIFTTQSVDVYVKACRQHWWRYPAEYGGGCHLWGQFDLTTPSTWYDIPACKDTYTWLGLVNANIHRCSCPVAAAGAPDSCWTYTTCANCTPGSTFRIYNKPDIYAEIGNERRCVPYDFTRSVTCSGYTQRMACLPFESWSVIAA